MHSEDISRRMLLFIRCMLFLFLALIILDITH